MSLFGARKTSTFQRATERAKNYEKGMESSSEASAVSSSHIGRLLDEVTGPATDDGTVGKDEREDLERNGERASRRL